MRVLGDIGPNAGLPVMDEKALRHEYLGDVDGVPTMLDMKGPAAVINTVLLLQPGLLGNPEEVGHAAGLSSLWG